MDDIYQINVAKTEFREGYETGDVDRVLSVFDSDGFTDMSYGEASNYGTGATAGLRMRAASLFADYSVKLSVIIIDIVVQGNTARDYGWHELTLTPKNGGETIRTRERYFELWTKKASGAWKVSLYITNGDVREQLAGHVSHWFLSESQASPAN